MNNFSPKAKRIYASMVCKLGELGQNSVARRGFIVFLIQVLGVGVAFGGQILIAQALGKEQYGFHTYVISWLFLLLLPAVFGMDTVALRFLSEYTESEAFAKIRGLLVFSRTFVFGMSVISFACSQAFVWLLYGADYLSLSEARGFAVGLCAIPVAAQLNLNTKLLWSCGKSALASLLIHVLRPGLVLVLVCMAWFVYPETLTARDSLLAYVIASFTIVVIGSLIVRSNFKVSCSKAEEAVYDRRLWVKVAMPLVLAASFQVVMGQCSTIALGLFLEYSEAGFYSAASRMVGLTSFGLTATNVIVAPMISRAYTRGETSELQATLRSGAVTIFCLTIPLVLFLLLAGKWVLSLFGEGFDSAYPSLVILCLGQAVNALCGCVGYLMVMTGNEKSQAKILCSTAVLGVILNFVLIPIWGIAGAAVATATTLAVWNIWMLVVVWKRLGMNPTMLSWVGSKANQ